MCFDLSQPVLFVMCAGNELFFCLLYIFHHIQEPAGKTVFWVIWRKQFGVRRCGRCSDLLCVCCSLALLAAGSLWNHLPAEVGHQPPAPHHRLPEHGCARRRRAGEKCEGAVSEKTRICHSLISGCVSSEVGFVHLNKSGITERPLQFVSQILKPNITVFIFQIQAGVPLSDHCFKSQERCWQVYKTGRTHVKTLLEL